MYSNTKKITIGVISDTHGKYTRFNRALSSLGKIDYLFHLGDGCNDIKNVDESLKIYSVKGNCDVYCNKPDKIEVDLLGHKFLLIHGHLFGVKYGLETIKQKTVGGKYSAVLFGHTHMPTIQSNGSTLLINPGSAALPRYNNKPTAAKLEIFEDRINPSIISLV